MSVTNLNRSGPIRYYVCSTSQTDWLGGANNKYVVQESDVTDYLYCLTIKTATVLSNNDV